MSAKITQIGALNINRGNITLLNDQAGRPPTMTVKRRWALITGVSEGGIGDALMAELLRNGINVIATGLKLELLDYLPDQHHPQHADASKVQLDVTSSASIAAAVKEVERLTDGKLDYLFNNAGYGYMMPLIDSDMAAAKAEFDVNVFGLMAVTQAFLPLLRAAKGTVVNQSSIAALRGGRQPVIGWYSASKAAVNSLSDTMRVELAPFGIKVVTLVTGDVTTGFWKHTAGGGHFGLPEGSPYANKKTRLEAMMRGESNPAGGHSKERYAQAVVADILRPNPSRYVRRGFLATVIWLVEFWLPTWVLDWAFARSTELNMLAPDDAAKKVQ